MCNAHNHPPNCVCGWGGVWYGKASDEDSWLFNHAPRPRALGRQHGTHKNPSAGLTVPNSKCPVCGERVFYYESENGGRVFFDDLGPPWPKHPCTSGGDGVSLSKGKRGWQKRNWKPLSFVSIDKSIKYDNTYFITGSGAGSQYKFFFSAEDIVMAEVVRYRVTQPGNFEISILDYNADDKSWFAWSGAVFTDEKKAHISKPISRVVIHSHKAVPAEGPDALMQEQEPQHLIQCPDCQSRVNPKNLLRHLLVQHKYIPIGSIGKITARLVVS